MFVSEAVSAFGLPACGHWEWQVEALYVRPSTCDLFYAIQDPRGRTGAPATTPLITEDSIPQGDFRALDPYFKFAGRGAASFVMDPICRDFKVQYTGFHHHYPNYSVPGTLVGFFWPSYGPPPLLNLGFFDGDPNLAQLRGRMRALAAFDYDAVDFEYGMRFGKCNKLQMRAFAGIHWFEVDHRFQAEYQGFWPFPTPDGLNMQAKTLDKQKVWAIGPRFGGEAKFDIYCGFSAAARCSAGVLAGYAKGSYKAHGGQATPGTDIVLVPLRAEHCHQAVVVPVINSRMGIRYTLNCLGCTNSSRGWNVFCCGKYQLDVEFGYEFTAYINPLRRPVFIDARGTNMTNCSNFDLDGLYLSFTLQL